MNNQFLITRSNLCLKLAERFWNPELLMEVATT
jgi:hypothetical protein